MIAFALGAPFEFTTEPGIPNLNPPAYWWGGEDTGWKLGLPELNQFIAVTPFAVLAIAMWSPDFLGHRAFQYLNYPKNAKKVVMNMDDTMCVAAARQIVGTALGGANIASSWGDLYRPCSHCQTPHPSRSCVDRLALCGRCDLGGLPNGLSDLATRA